MKEHDDRLRVFENRVLRRISGCNMVQDRRNNRMLKKIA
jgi:hypothetical protein